VVGNARRIIYIYIYTPTDRKASYEDTDLFDWLRPGPVRTGFCKQGNESSGSLKTVYSVKEKIVSWN
jgi:hypothetical protein